MQVRAKKPSANEPPSLGANLRRLRQERGWNLSTLAAKSALPQSTLSKVENGQMSLNYDKLLQVATAMDVDVARLFDSSRPGTGTLMARRVISRHSDKDFGVEGHYRFKHLVTELKNRLMAPLLLEVGDTPHGSGGSQPQMMDIAGERFAYVLQGPVDFLCAEYETVRLETGDALYVDAAMPHAFVAPPGRKARVLTVLSSTDPDYLRLVREAALSGHSDATQRFRELKARAPRD